MIHQFREPTFLKETKQPKGFQEEMDSKERRKGWEARSLWEQEDLWEIHTWSQRSEMRKGKITVGQVKESELYFDCSESHWGSVLSNQIWFTLLKYLIFKKKLKDKKLLWEGTQGGGEYLELEWGREDFETNWIPDICWTQNHHSVAVKGKNWELRLTFRFWVWPQDRWKCHGYR